jgi:membrane-bound serine protease (ClpP class)
MGKEGVASSYLRPTGTALFDSRRIDVITEGEFIASGTRIKVVHIEANRVIGRRA